MYKIKFFRALISHSQSQIAFCHNDMQEGNILLSKERKIQLHSSSDEDGHQQNNSLNAFNPMDPRLVLIDFEYASYNYS